MPIYEYYCKSCQQGIAIWRSHSDTSKLLCPNCGSGELVRLISSVSIIKSDSDRLRNLSWLDRDLARRLRKKVPGKTTLALSKTLDWMEFA
jgi:putative FmdB family regulatory protein